MKYYILLVIILIFFIVGCDGGESTTSIDTNTTDTLYTTTTISESTTEHETTTSVTESTTETSSVTTTTEYLSTTTTTSPGPTNTTTTVTNPSFWRDEWPDLSEGLIVNVVHFGADPADDGRDDGVYIQNAIDFAAGEVSLSRVAPVSMPETWRTYYQFWEDAKTAQITGDWSTIDKYFVVATVEEPQGINPWYAALLGIGLLITAIVVLAVFQYVRKRYNILGYKKKK